MIPPGVILAVATVSVGWLALLPVRDRLGSLGYHLAALPVGVLGWSVVAAASMALRSAWTAPLVLGSLLGWSAIVWLLAWRFADARVRHPVRLSSGARPGVRWWTYPLFLTGIAAFAILFAKLGVSAFSADGWSQYEPDGMILDESGMTTPRALGNRMVSVSAIHAAYHFFGGEFTHVIQPVMGLVTALLVAAGVWWASGEGRLSRLQRAALSATPALVMATNAVYAFHSVYIHSHMMSALFIVLAMVALMRSWRPDGLDPAWLLVAGLGTAGVVLSRPDGAAYAVVLILVAAAVLARNRASAALVDSYFAPLLTTSLVVVSGGVIQHGYWWTRKLSLQTLLLFFAAYVVVWLLLRFFAAGAMLSWLKRGTNILRLVIGLDVLALIIVWRLWAESVMNSLTNMVSNLLSTGGYRSFWPFAAGIVAVSLVLRPHSTRHRFTAYALFAVVQFLVIAFVLHGIRHPGRIGWGDSFTRVSFQIVPVIYLYTGLYLNELAEAFGGGRRDRS